MSDNKYNGWANYPTWNVALWLSNDEGTQSYWADQAQEIYNDAEPEYDWQTREEAAALTLADMMKEEYEEAQPDLGGMAGMYNDLLSSALDMVDWREIAEHYIEDVDKEEEQASEESEEE